MLPADAMRLDRAHVLAVHELVIHVEEVLVHEGIVTGDLTIQATSLVVLALGGTQSGGRAQFSKSRIAWEDKDESVNFACRIAAHAVGQAFCTQVRHAHASTTAVVGPA